MTRPVERMEPILECLKMLWKRYPDWRFCQMISNIHGVGRQDIFFTEDDKFLNMIVDILKADDRND